MIYEKKPITFDDQIIKLQSRGLKFCNISDAKFKLSSISYYRLRAYTYPFQDNNNPDHPFVIDVSFEDIFALYKFDHSLRVIVFNMLGIVEIAFRTQIIYQFAIEHGAHWQLESSLFRDTVKFAQHLSSLETEISRSNECFVDHYKHTYTDPVSPPSWMSLEVSSFGLLSKIFQNLKKGRAKYRVTNYFGLNDISILENWMLCFGNLRNICAHHSRLWNRRLTAKPKLPNNPISYFPKTAIMAFPNKLYPVLCCLLYTLDIIRPSHDYKDQIKTIVANCPLGQLKEMGFPKDWKSDPFWN